MKNLSSYIKVGPEQLAYTIIGEGSQYILCFHGFDEGKEVYSNWLDSYGKRFRMVCFDLPAHGDSSTFDNYKINQRDIKLFAQTILQTFEIKAFHLLGFSIGSRIVFGLLNEVPNNVLSAYLYAPDGVYEHPVYKLAVRSLFGKKLFEYYVHHPDRLINRARLFYKLKWISVSMLRYIEKRWPKVNLREKIYNTWQSLSNLRMRNIPENVPVKIVFGEKDSLMPPKMAKAFKGIDNIETFVVPFGHQLIISKLNDWNRTIL